MSQVTAKQLSEVVGVSVDRLLEQLREAGVKVAGADDPISDEDKMTLLESLRSHHGKDKAEGPKKITLQRKSKSEIRVTGSTGRNTTSRSINVEVRKKRTYIRRAEVEPEEVPQEVPQELDEETKKQQQEALIAKQKADEEARLAEQERLAREAEEARIKAEEEQRIKEELEAREAIERERLEREMMAIAKQVVASEAEATAAAAAAAAAEAEPVVKTETADDKSRATKTKRKSAADNKTRYGRKELHVKSGADHGSRKGKGKKAYRQSANMPENVHGFEKPTAPVVRTVAIPDAISVAELAQKMAIKAGDVIKALMQMGTMATINQMLDQDTAILLVEEMGHNAVTAKGDNFEEELLQKSTEVSDEHLVSRPPVVTIMGHVDHGKTSLLDHIRKTRVASGEAGGITQHIGAYHVETPQGVITFLDTPGHAAFSAMRARGAQATDVVILVVAADDGVMPQTKEAIQHAKAAGVPLIVAVNKIDKENADPDRVRNELSAVEVIPEEWGGEHMFVNVSAHTGEGIDDLLEAILLQSEVLELQASDTGLAKGIVIEASLDKGRGPVATVLVQSGMLEKGQILLAGTEFGRVRAMYDEGAKMIKSAGPSIPVVVLGLSGTPKAGDEVFVVENERRAREIAQTRETRIRESRLAEQQKAKIQGMFDAMTEGDVADLNLLVKCDVQGSSEALNDALTKLSTSEVKVVLVGTGVGGINESDINLAAASGALVIGFNVRADASAKRIAGDYGIDIRYYSVIYEVIDDVKAAMSGLLSPETQESIIGLAEVKDVFKSPKFGAVAGSMVIEGTVKRGKPIRVLRDNVVIYEGELESLRRFKDDVDEVRNGTECGIAVKNYNDVKPGDQIEVFDRVQVARTIE
jgi:translation initiation factor IF-2